MHKFSAAPTSTWNVISTLALSRTLRIGGIALGAVALVGTAAYATVSAAGAGRPSTASDASTTSAICNNFMNHFAADLGTDRSKVNAAYQQALAETLADEVKAGKLTQKQADAIKARLAGKPPCSLASRLRPNRGAAPFFTRQLVIAAASALDLTPDQLTADLKNGMSLSQIAAAHNPPITEAQFRSGVLATIKPQLDQAVTDKKLTAEQEQKILDRIQNGPIPFWDKAPATQA